MTTALEKYVKTIFTSNIKGIVIDDKHCMKYTNKSCVKPEEIAFTIHLPFGLLTSWHENKKPVLENYSYVQILNAFIGERYPTKINENENRGTITNNLLGCGETISLQDWKATA